MASDATALAELSGEALTLYGRVVAGEDVEAHDGPALAELRRVGLVRPAALAPGRFTAVRPWDVESRLLADERRRLRRALERMDAVPAVLAEFATVYAGQMFLTSSGVEIIEDREMVNARIADSVNQAEREILAAQPGSRSRVAIDVAVARDGAALRRGVSLRNLYHPSSRSNPFVQQYVESTAELGAEARTVGSEFPRMVIVDRRHAFVDLKLDGAPDNGALYIADIAVVAWIRVAVFEAFWAIGQEWVWGARGVEVLTSEVEETVLRLFVEGLSQVAIGPRVGLSKRGMNRLVADLKERFGVETLFQLGVAWEQRRSRRGGDA